jgi:maltose/maltodextrin transport system substrate-binding protein
MVAYVNRSTPNHDLVKEFVEHYLLTEEGLTAMNRGKAICIPALISVYNRMAKDDTRLQQLKTCVDYGEVMPNVPQMSRFFSAVGGALQIATDGRASAQASLRDAEANMRRR